MDDYFVEMRLADTGESLLTFSNLIQGIVPVEAFSRVVDWNIERNELEFRPTLEEEMLAEELAEYWQAKTLIEKLDAILDFAFVAVGTLVKQSKNNADEIGSGMAANFQIAMTDFISRCKRDGLTDAAIRELFHRGFVIVCEANEQKSAQKKENGKIAKPKDFVGPEQKLTELYNELKENPPMEPMPPFMRGQ